MVILAVLFGQDEVEIKHALRPNMVHLYNEEPMAVDNLGALFTEGLFYGRIRFNSFGHQWKKELNINGIPVRKDHAIMGMGGSLIYRSGYLHGFGVGAGLYVTEALGTLKRKEAYLYKAGKGAFSRYDRLKDGDSGIISLAQAYLAYRNGKTEVKLGRQIFESFLTKSNDTKMIPNTFEGFTLQSKELPKTVLKAAYLTRQKLRDHSGFHHLFAYGYQAGEPYSAYSENDDSGMHVGITKEKLDAKGIKDRLVVLEAKNRSIAHLTLTANYTAVPELISYAMLQADYEMVWGEWHVIPGVRYMQQFDNGAGAVVGEHAANRKMITAGYKDPASLDSWLLGIRTDVVHDEWKFRFGYTQVADKADLITPWRGFPTGGFTRAMSQYNWYANTKSYMLQTEYDFVDSFEDIRLLGRVVYQDFDDNKPGVQADSTVFTLDVMRGFGGLHNFYAKLRYGHAWVDDHTPIVGVPGHYKADTSYDEVRLEMDYLF